MNNHDIILSHFVLTIYSKEGTHGSPYLKLIRRVLLIKNSKMNAMLRRALPSRLKYEINTLLLSCQKGEICPTDNVHLQGRANQNMQALLLSIVYVILVL